MTYAVYILLDVGTHSWSSEKYKYTGNWNNGSRVFSKIRVIFDLSWAPIITAVILNILYKIFNNEYNYIL